MAETMNRRSFLKFGTLTAVLLGKDVTGGLPNIYLPFLSRGEVQVPESVTAANFPRFILEYWARFDPKIYEAVVNVSGLEALGPQTGDSLRKLYLRGLEAVAGANKALVAGGVSQEMISRIYVSPKQLIMGVNQNLGDGAQTIITSASDGTHVSTYFGPKIGDRILTVPNELISQVLSIAKLLAKHPGYGTAIAEG